MPSGSQHSVAHLAWRVPRGVLAAWLSFLPALSFAAWNNPYPAHDDGRQILYTAFRERPKHLDPARSYSSNEYDFIAQIYEPPFQYHYLRRPFQLIPLTATEIPVPVYLDRAGRRLPADAPIDRIAYSVYTIRLQPGIRYQPHPAFARDAQGRARYHSLTVADLKRIHAIADFPHSGTRELVAADYVHQIKRLAHPRLHSPILSVMQDYIVGLKEYAVGLRAELKRLEQSGPAPFLDLTRYPLKGAEVVDRYSYRVTIHGKYPPLLYWMAMPFFAPMAPEVDRFFSQPGLRDKNLTLDWYPVGTGPYMLTVNDPNRQMVLERNPHYRDERYPADGEPGDRERGLLDDAGRRLPMIDRIVFSLEKENIPYWNKFMQGYYDRSAVPAESFDQAVRFTGSGDTDVSDDMRARGIQLNASVATSTYYVGFNMLDPVLGGYSERARKLRRAISIAIDIEEQISIFRNGRGIAAQGPIPPGIFGYRPGCEGLNSYVYECVQNAPQRRPLGEARRLLAEAGYPDGRERTTGRPLLLYFDTPATGPAEKARFDWYANQLAKLNIQLVVRATDYNRFQEKMRKGDAQLFEWGWNADYPDPENFLFLLYGPNKKVGGEGENAANYDNPEFNRLFEQLKNMDNGPARRRLIERALDVARRDAPWIWGVHPRTFTLDHAWLRNAKPHQMANNTMKYLRLDPELRRERREAWNRPVRWPLLALGGLLLAGVAPAVILYRRREARAAR
jgi:ABC-type transport system substrate-binding protein